MNDEWVGVGEEIGTSEKKSLFARNHFCDIILAWGVSSVD